MDIAYALFPIYGQYIGLKAFKNGPSKVMLLEILQPILQNAFLKSEKFLMLGANTMLCPDYFLGKGHANAQRKFFS